MSATRIYFVLVLLCCASACARVQQLEGVEETVEGQAGKDVIYQDVGCGQPLELTQGLHVALAREITAEKARIVIGDQEVALAQDVTSLFEIGSTAPARMDCFGLPGKAVLGIVNLDTATAYIAPTPSLFCERYVDKHILSGVAAGEIKVRTRACVGGTMTVRVRDAQGSTVAVGESRESQTTDPHIWFAFKVPIEANHTVHVSCNPGDASLGACNWEIGSGR